MSESKIVRPAIKFAVRQGFRPSAGRLLFSYTHAWIVGSGLAEGGSIPASMARKIAGDTAIAYHTGKTGCFAIDAGQLTLTPAGVDKFSTRAKASVDAKAVDAYMSIMQNGTPDGEFIKVGHAIGELKTAA